jgi:hypothetical protein
MISRGRLGDDVEANLITLCGDCHRKIHQSGKVRKSMSILHKVAS